MKTFLNNRAFTLAELMAVVVIIAILAGIAIGSYRRSVDRAKFADGRSLAHQIAAARDSYYYDRLYGGGVASIPTSVYQEAGVRGKVKAETCVGRTAKGREFCQSMGYSSPALGC